MVDAKRNNSHPGPLAPGAAASRPLRPASVPASRCQGGGASSPWLLRPLHRGRDRCHRQDRGEGRSLVRVRWPRCVVTDRPPFYRGRSRRPAAALIYQLIVAEARPTEAALKWAFPARRTTAALASASSPGTSGWSSHGRQGPTLAASALRSANGRRRGRVSPGRPSLVVALGERPSIGPPPSPGPFEPDARGAGLAPPHSAQALAGCASHRHHRGPPPREPPAVPERPGLGRGRCPRIAWMCSHMTTARLRAAPSVWSNPRAASRAGRPSRRAVPASGTQAAPPPPAAGPRRPTRRRGRPV